MPFVDAVVLAPTARLVHGSETVVQPSDSAAFLYVALTRGMESNRAHVVTHELEYEPRGYHP